MSIQFIVCSKKCAVKLKLKSQQVKHPGETALQ